MGFFESLRRALTGDPSAPVDAEVDQRIKAAWGLDDAQGPQAAGESHLYDRSQWHRKLKTILGNLPSSRAEWSDLERDARALNFEPEWVARCQLEEFELLIRKAVSDRIFTDDEHQKLELARQLIGLTEAEAESLLERVSREAETFFGGPIQEEA
jgi:hypothetical protein